METETIIVVSVFGGALLLLLLISIILCAQVASLRRKVGELGASGRLRVQKLKMNSDKNHAFHNPALTPDEELSRRGYSMYQVAEDDVESGRGTDRQTGGQFVEELAKELEHRQQKQNTTPSFLLQGIKESKNKRTNPNGNNANRQSETNPNFIY
ncbi:uncharacterized protein LOC112044178 [Bicyclus anynana]|uniref:Uncharacterized protein LOC112044178 n=1 Tax=Bicyclus anynana TaxID=110368 RepID=A0A6J1MMI4_BICAN|nr:uncharacterized protein LOC112044178 [Bicyclus anynana]